MKVSIIKEQSEKERYSDALKEFEKEFTYPLGDRSFYIAHGYNGSNYFSFFDNLGEAEYVIAEDNNKKVIGFGCLIYRDYIESGKSTRYCYLCDFKVKPAYQKRGIIYGAIRRYFLTLSSGAMKSVFVNMSPSAGHSLVDKLKHFVDPAKLAVWPYSIYEWTKENYVFLCAESELLRDNFVLISNNGRKDIIIEGEKADLYHLCERTYYQNNLSEQRGVDFPLHSVDVVDDGALIMLGTAHPDLVSGLLRHHIEPSLTALFGSYDMSDFEKSYFSTAEI